MYKHPLTAEVRTCHTQNVSVVVHLNYHYLTYHEVKGRATVHVLKKPSDFTEEHNVHYHV